jgi:spermidine/putrescine transport system permease protein
MIPKHVVFGETLTRPQELRRAALTSGPGLLWVTVYLLVPLLAIVVISFLTSGNYGQLQWKFTLENFKRFIGFGVFGFDPLYPQIVLRTLGLALATTALCIVVALPLTFFIAGLHPRSKHIALMLVVIPFWTNMLIRTYAWQMIFSGQGWLVRALAGLGILSPGEALYPGSMAVFIVLVCDFVPVMVLPLYASVDKIDWALAEAASDLGANGWRVFWHALLPQVKPGLMAGAILVFIAATGQFVIPDLMGGAKTVLLGNAIQQQFGFSRDWPFGSAIACLAMLIVMGGLRLFARTAGEEGKEALL